MATRRCFHRLIRRATVLLSSDTNLSALPNSLSKTLPLRTLTSDFPQIFTNSGVQPTCRTHWSQSRHFSSDRRDNEDGSDNEDDDEVDDSDDNYDEEEEEMRASGDDESVPALSLKREYTVEEKEAEAAAIGYKVIAPLDRSDRVFRPYEPVFAVVQIGSHQFKVSNGDCIFTERLKFCEVNNKLILNKVLLLGSSSQTIVGRPIVPDAAVHAVVEEHALDAKVIIFKKKRRKNYRRTKGHRQELTKLRITDIQGIEKPENIVAGKPSKAAVKKPEKVAVAA